MGTATRTFTNQKLDPIIYPEDARTLAKRFGVSLTIARGTILGIKTSDKLLYAYDDASVTGLAVAKFIAAYDIKTDASGNVTYTTSSTPDEWGASDLLAPVYIVGFFRVGDLVGLDAAAVADLGKLYGDIAAADSMLHVT